MRAADVHVIRAPSGPTRAVVPEEAVTKSLPNHLGRVLLVSTCHKGVRRRTQGPPQRATIVWQEGQDPMVASHVSTHGQKKCEQGSQTLDAMGRAFEHTPQ